MSKAAASASAASSALPPSEPAVPIRRAATDLPLAKALGLPLAAATEEAAIGAGNAAWEKPEKPSSEKIWFRAVLC